MPKKDTKLTQLFWKWRTLTICFWKSMPNRPEQPADSRQQEKVQYFLKDIMGIVFFAVILGNDEWTEIADFAVDEKETIQKYLELPNGILSHDTVQRVFFILCPDELQDMLVSIPIQLVSASEKLDRYLYRNDGSGVR